MRQFERWGFMGHDIYHHLGKELRALFNELKPLKIRRIDHIRHHMDKIESLAKKIGKPLDEEAARLRLDVERFLEKPSDPRLVEILQQHAMRLEQETREI